MVDKNYSEAAVDPNFVETINLLNENNISYWVCHGSLLGLIRDGKLIPWDHDIDFAVWDHETDKNYILDIMLSHGYQQEVITEDMDCLHFFAENKKGRYWNKPMGHDLLATVLNLVGSK